MVVGRWQFAPTFGIRPTFLLGSGQPLVPLVHLLYTDEFIALERD